MKKRKSKSSGDNYLPPELMREVLARLPVKTLIKFRCVCKTWRSLIDSSDFISLHSEFHYNIMNNAQLLAWEKCKRIGHILTLRRSDTFKTMRKLGRIPKFHRFYGYCNGLMLISYDRMNRVMLWNPNIGKSLLLPVPPMDFVFGYHLGFVPSSNDYKVLTFGYKKLVAIYSLNDDCWRLISDPVNDEDCGLSLISPFRGTNAVPCGGAIYSMDSKVKNLCSFNFDAEEFSFLQLPESVKESIVCFIFRIGDSIAIFTMSSENSLIWVMQKDGGENLWRLWFSGDPNSIFCNLLRKKIVGPFYSSILYIKESNTFLISYEMTHRNLLSSRTHGNLISYNLTSQEIKRLGKSIRGRLFFSTYVESLVFHKGFEGQRLISFPREEEMLDNS